MLTAKDAEIDKVVGLELGADDYVTKPYSSRELVARVRAVLRRQGEPEELVSSTVQAGPVRMDIERHVVTVGGEPVSLPLKEFELLEMLLRNSGRVLTRGQLIDRVWGSDYVGDTKTLDVHVKRLRSKVEPDPSAPRPPDHGPRPGLQVRPLNREDLQPAGAPRPTPAPTRRTDKRRGTRTGCPSFCAEASGLRCSSATGSTSAWPSLWARCLPAGTACSRRSSRPVPEP